MSRVPVPLALLLGIAAVLGVAWTVATAPLQGPDEPEHIGYVAHLAQTGHKPSATTGAHGPFGTDEVGALEIFGFGPARRHRQTRTPWSPAVEHQFRVFEDTLPSGAPGLGDGPTPVGNNPPLYYAYAAVGWKLTPGSHFFGRVYVVRLMGVLLLLATTVFAWLLAGEALGRRRVTQTVAAGFVALLPMNGFMAGIVNTDMMLATVWTAFLWLALRTTRLGLTWPRAAGLSAVAVASILTHGRGLAILPALVVALVVAWVVHRRPRNETLKAAASSGAVLAVGLFLFRFAFSSSGGGGSLYGGQTDIATTGALNLKQLIMSVWNFYLPHLDSTAARLGPGIGYRQIFVQQYFSGVFSSFDVYFPFWVYDAVLVLVALLGIALFTLGVANWRRVLARWPVIVILGAAGLSMLAVLHFTSYRSLVGNGGTNPLIVGRYLLALGGIFGVMLAAVTHLLPRRAGVAVGAFVLVCLLCLSVGGLALSMERFYA